MGAWEDWGFKCVDDGLWQECTMDPVQELVHMAAGSGITVSQFHFWHALKSSLPKLFWISICVGSDTKALKSS